MSSCIKQQKHTEKKRKYDEKGTILGERENRAEEIDEENGI